MAAAGSGGTDHRTDLGLRRGIEGRAKLAGWYVGEIAKYRGLRRTGSQLAWTNRQPWAE